MITKSRTSSPEDGAPPTFKGIPLVLYQSWIDDDLPPKMRENVEAVLRENPEFDYVMYNDADCREFLQAHFGRGAVLVFDLLKPGAYKSDFWRYCALYINGGVYMDIKCRPQRKLLDIIGAAGQESPIFIRDSPGWGTYCHYAWNGFFAVAPRDAVLGACIYIVTAIVKERLYGTDCLSMTGPGILGRALYSLMPTYKFMYTFKDYVICDGYQVPVITEYAEYRDEHAARKVGDSYATLWSRREAYNVLPK